MLEKIVTTPLKIIKKIRIAVKISLGKRIAAIAKIKAGKRVAIDVTYKRTGGSPEIASGILKVTP